MPSRTHSRARSSTSTMGDLDSSQASSLLGSSDDDEAFAGKQSWDCVGYVDDKKDTLENIDSGGGGSGKCSPKWHKDFVLTIIPDSESISAANGNGGRWWNKETVKTALAFLFLGFGFLVNLTSIAVTHDRVPDRSVPALPDVVFDNLDYYPQLMKIADIFVTISIISMLFVFVTHPCRWIVGRRVTFILAILYLMRSVAMYVTVFPVAEPELQCAPKADSTTFTVVVNRVWKLFVAGGMRIGKKETCGEYMYSGHTAMMVTAMLTVKEYGSGRFWILKGLMTGITWCGMAALLLARGHYTIDVIVGYYAATRMFWTYHNLVHNFDRVIDHPQKNYYSQTWWFPIFMYFERNLHSRFDSNKNVV